MKAYRVLFSAAAVYNLAFALASGIAPAPFFAWFDAPPPDQPLPWRGVAVVVGLFAALYAYAAWRVERADLAVAVGLASKVLGPTAWLVSVALGTAPPTLFPLMLCGDLVWCFPLLFYLLRGRRWRAAVVAWIGVAAHLAAAAGLLVVWRGTELNPDLAARQQWIAGAAGAWTATWFCWSWASMSLLALCVVWAQRLRAGGTRRGWTLAAVATVAVGVVLDLSGESVMIAEVGRPGLSLVEFAAALRAYQLLSPAAANGLYCLGGMVLSVAAWQSGQLRGLAGGAGFVMWTVGLVLTLAALANHRWGLAVSGAGVMLIYIPWSAWLGWRLSPRG